GGGRGAHRGHFGNLDPLTLAVHGRQVGSVSRSGYAAGTSEGVHPIGWTPSASVVRQPQTEAAFLAIADFLLAAWFLCMTPLLTALSSLRDAARSAVSVASTSPEAAASRNLRMNVRTS